MVVATVTVLGASATAAQAPSPAPGTTPGAAALAARLAAIRGEPGAEALVGPTLEHAARALERAGTLRGTDAAAARRAERICGAALTLAERQLARTRARAAAAEAERRAAEAEARALGAQRALEAARARRAQPEAAAERQATP